jgi:hypothetical protein
VQKLKDYAFDFMDRTIYDADRLEILYLMFRHKVAHLAQPYAVFDTKKKRAFQGQPGRFTWTVEESGARPAIEIVQEKLKQGLAHAVLPHWPRATASITLRLEMNRARLYVPEKNAKCCAGATPWPMHAQRPPGACRAAF